MCHTQNPSSYNGMFFDFFFYGENIQMLCIFVMLSLAVCK